LDGSIRVQLVVAVDEAAAAGGSDGYACKRIGGKACGGKGGGGAYGRNEANDDARPTKALGDEGS
jgi:hypothetical protein